MTNDRNDTGADHTDADDTNPEQIALVSITLDDHGTFSATLTTLQHCAAGVLAEVLQALADELDPDFPSDIPPLDLPTFDAPPSAS